MSVKFVDGEYLPLTDTDLSIETAKAHRLEHLNNLFENSLLNGFASTADGNTRMYAIDSTALLKWTGVLAVINSGKGPSSINIKDFNGNSITLTSTQFQQMASDGFAFFNNQEAHLWNLETQVNAATTIDQVNAIEW